MDSTSAPSSGRGPTSAGGDKSTAEADTIMVSTSSTQIKYVLLISLIRLLIALHTLQEPLGRVLDSMMNSLLKPKRTQVSKDCENIRSISSMEAAKNGFSILNTT